MICFAAGCFAERWNCIRPEADDDVDSFVAAGFVEALDQRGHNEVGVFLELGEHPIDERLCIGTRPMLYFCSGD